MNNIITAITRSKLRSASIAIVALAVLVPAGLFAWGPDRPTYTIEQPADHVVFNSITNNPAHGDERNFVQIKEATANNSTYAEEVALQPGKEYEVNVYYHNNAASNLNSAADNYKGIALNTQMRVQMPASVAAGGKARFTGIVSASNATPASVWDEAYGTSASAVALRYVQNSATIHNFGATNGKPLPDTLVSTGTNLGYDALDGKVPGCNQFSGYVTFKFKVDQPNFEVEKTVSKAGQNAYAKSITALPNEEVEYKIQYKNTGTTQQNDVVIKDVLPAGISYVAGSSYAATSKTNGQYEKISDNVTTTGVNLGSYAPGGNTFLKFKAKVTDNSQLKDCGTNTLINKATAETNNGNKSSTANVVVSKTCENVASYTCDSLAITKIDRQNFTFKTTVSASNATFKSVAYVITDANGKEIDRKTSTEKTLKYAFSANGNYSVQAFVTFTVNGSDKTVTAASCKKPLVVTPTETTPCTVPGKEYLPKDSPECVETPAELPETGISGGAATLVGIGIATAALGYAATNRRLRSMIVG